MIFLSLVNKNYALTSRQTYHYSAGQLPRVITPGTQLVRTANPLIPWQITTDTTPFSVHIPRLIQSISIIAKLQNTNAPVVYLTAVGRGTLGDMPVLADSSLLNTLKWNRATVNEVTLWQRPNRVNGKDKKKILPVRQYATFDQVLSDPAAASRTAVIGADPMSLVRLAHYQPLTQPLTTPHTFRGSQQLYIYAANEDLHFQFNVVDLNRTKKKATMGIIIQKIDGVDNDPVVIHRQVVDDDGIVNGLGRPSSPRLIDVLVPGVTAGVYHVTITAHNDLLLSNLTSWQQNLSFSGEIYLAEGPSYISDATFRPATVLTNGTLLSASADHDPGKQSLSIGGKKINLHDVRQPVRVDGLQGITSVTIAKPDIVLTSDRFLTLTPFTLLPVGGTPVSLYPSPNLDPFDYLLAKYIPRNSKDPVVVTGSFPVDNLKLSGVEGKLLTFRIDTPGLQMNGYEVGLTSIKATLYRGQFPWAKIKKKLNQLID